MFDLRSKLQKTRDGLISPLKRMLQRREGLGAADEEEVESLLHAADLGVEACGRIMERLKSSRQPLDYRSFLRSELMSLLSEAGSQSPDASPCPCAIIVIGVNGVGKT